MKTFTQNPSKLAYCSPATKAVVAGSVTLVITLLIFALEIAVSRLAETLEFLAAFVNTLQQTSVILVIITSALFISAPIVAILNPDSAKIKRYISRRLLLPCFGNPLGLREGDVLPSIKVKKSKKYDGDFEVYISCISSSIEKLQSAVSCLSSSLTNNFKNFAVTRVFPDVNMSGIKFIVSNVSKRKQIIINDIAELKHDIATKIKVQQGVDIDLTKTGSMIVSGRTRSGKSTFALSSLLSILMHGPDEFGSSITIVDGKRAELSMLPGVIAPDEDGNVYPVYKALLEFEQAVKLRQRALNDLSKKHGNAVLWHNSKVIQMRPSILYIDEYVSLRNLVPRKASKEHPDFDLAAFDSLLLRLFTMASSAGAYVWLSVPIASVGEAGVPTIVRESVSSKILFKPSREAALYLWTAAELDVLTFRDFKAGDAFFSSQDGIHDTPSFVSTPDICNIDCYKQLGVLLEEYNAEKNIEAAVS